MKYDVYGALKYVNLYFLCFYAADDIQTYEKLLNCYFFNSHANDLNENGVLSKDRVALRYDLLIFRLCFKRFVHAFMHNYFYIISIN